MASKHPNGAYSIAALGRTLNRIYEIPLCDVRFAVGNADTVAVFGDYKNLILETAHETVRAVYIQDLADDTAYDVTKNILFDGKRTVISGELIRKIGTLSQPREDTSEPGVVIRLAPYDETR